ncbi:MAG: hypothetical protein IKP00_01595 [Victivallales bacterium]|nr:hypothetical protein [Victivallales bacterium]
MLCKVLAATLVSSILLVADEAITALPAIKAPVLDGVISEDEWNGSATGVFRENRGWNLPQQPTTWFAACDKENLYFAFKCMESDIAGIRKSFAHIEERDSAIYTDDCIELFIDPFGNDKGGLFHFAVNTNGIIYDDYNGDIAFQSGIKVACKVEKDSWTMEILLPFADLGIVPKGAELLRMNLGRERQGGIRPEYSCLGEGSGGFASRNRLVAFRPLPFGKALPPVTFKALGSPLATELCFCNTDTASKNSFNVIMEPFDKEHNKIRDYRLKTTPGEETVFEYSMVLGTHKLAGYTFKVLDSEDDNKAIYSNMFIFPELAAEKRLLAMAIEKPLFTELLGKAFPPRRDFHGFQWVFGAGNAGNMQQFALQKGLPYSNYDIAKEHKETGMANYANVTMISWLNTNLYCEELKTPIASMPRVLDKNITCGLSFRLLVIPEIRRLWLEDVKTIASRGARLIVWGDELAEVLESHMISEYQKMPDNQALKSFDSMIKQKYGQGKYGIPKTIEESNPLAWIAYRRALNDELVSMYREGYKLAKSINPDIIVVSDDPVGNQSKLYSYSDWKDAVDIVTQQLYPKNSPNIDSFGFITRYMATLSGAKEVWPCPHVEEYAASFTPQEVLYKLSGAVRSGATGFHYYLHDTTGANSNKKYLCHERWGAPDRYAVEIGAQKLLATMPRLAFPGYDTAVFTATDSLRAIPGLMFRRPPEQDMYLHGFLGYGAGVNYRFINELTLDNLSQYKLIATVENAYLAREAFNALKQYVHDGGILLVLNQNAFSSTPEGADMKADSAAFTGATAVGDSATPAYFTYAGQKVPVTAIRCAKLKVAPGAIVTAVFANGDPAIIENAFGMGKVFTLAANPCGSKLAGSSEWKSFFLNFCKNCGAKTQCDIWRFQLPDSLLPKQEPIQGKCITNNFVKWEHFNPTTPCNDTITGSYTLSPEPTYSKDSSPGKVPFSKGKLTDRPKAVVGLSACRGKSTWRDWTVAWKDIAEPISIKCDWSEPRDISCIKFFVAGTWRDAKLEIGGKSYDFPCPADFNKDPVSVREVIMQLPIPVKETQLNITIAPDKSSLTIAEMEIWSK